MSKKKSIAGAETGTGLVKSAKSPAVGHQDCKEHEWLSPQKLRARGRDQTKRFIKRGHGVCLIGNPDKSHVLDRK